MTVIVVQVTACVFKRKKDCLWEEGVYVEAQSTNCIIDTAGKPVPAPIEDYHLCTSEGLINFHLSDTHRSHKLVRAPLARSG